MRIPSIVHDASAGLVSRDPAPAAPAACGGNLARRGRRGKSATFRAIVGLGALGAVACNVACNKVSEPAPEPKSVASETTPKGEADSPASAAKEPAAPHPKAASAEAELKWTGPDGWKRGPDRPMRKATYEIPPAQGDKQPGELAVFYFGKTQGGSVDANIQRWIGQFGSVEEESVQRSQQTKNGLKQHIVEIASGTYTNTMAMRGPKGPQENFALLGAVVESPSGKYFFKMTGPANTVKAERDKFFKLLEEMQHDGAGGEEGEATAAPSAASEDAPSAAAKPATPKAAGTAPKSPHGGADPKAQPAKGE